MAATSQLDERRTNAAQHQALFREVNERIDQLSQQWSTTPEYVCECGELSCAETISVTAEAYQAIRGDRDCFVVIQGHEIAELEEVVERTGRYLVIRKRSTRHVAPSWAPA